MENLKPRGGWWCNRSDSTEPCYRRDGEAGLNHDVHPTDWNCIRCRLMKKTIDGVKSSWEVIDHIEPIKSNTCNTQKNLIQDHETDSEW